MFANSFDSVILEVKTGTDEEVSGPIRGTYYLNFRTVHLAPKSRGSQCQAFEEDSCQECSER